MLAFVPPVTIASTDGLDEIYSLYKIRKFIIKLDYLYKLHILDS